MNLTDNSPAVEMCSALSPQPSALSPQPAWRKEIICALLIVAGLVWWHANRFGSAGAMLSNLRGEQLLAEFNPLSSTFAL